MYHFWYELCLISELFYLVSPCNFKHLDELAIMKEQVFTVSTTQRLTLRCMAVIAMEKTIGVRSTLIKID